MMMERLETLVKAAVYNDRKVGRTPESESVMASHLPFTSKLIPLFPVREVTPLHIALEFGRIPMGNYFHLNFLPSADESPVSPLAISRNLMMELLWYRSLPRSVKNMDAETTANEQTVTSNNHEVLIELETSLKAPTYTSPTKSSRYRKGNRNCLILLIAAILAFLTFKAGLNPPVTLYSGAVLLWLNSAVFVASEAVIVFLARELPLQPWLLVSVFSLFGTYICSIITTFPHTALTVLYAGSPLLVFLAVSRNCVSVLHQPSFSAHNELSA